VVGFRLAALAVCILVLGPWPMATAAEQGASMLTLSEISEFISEEQYSQGMQSGLDSKWDGRPRLYSPAAWSSLADAVDSAVRSGSAEAILAEMQREPDRDTIRAYPILATTLFSTFVKHGRDVEAETILLAAARLLPSHRAFARDYLYSLYFMISSMEASGRPTLGVAGFVEVAKSLCQYLNEAGRGADFGDVLTDTYLRRVVEGIVSAAAQSDDFFTSLQAVSWLMKVTDGMYASQFSAAELSGLSSFFRDLPNDAPVLSRTERSISVRRAGGLLIAVVASEAREPVIAIFSTPFASSEAAKPVQAYHGQQAQQLLTGGVQAPPPPDHP